MPALEQRPHRVYGQVFWLAYLANALTMIAISILVRYADFVSWVCWSVRRLLTGSVVARRSSETS